MYYLLGIFTMLKLTDDIEYLLFNESGQRFLFTDSNKKYLLEIAKRKKLKDYEVKPYGVKIIKLDPHTKEVIKWKKIEGHFSLWIIPQSS